MDCQKTTFETSLGAQKRAQAINGQNKRNKGQKKQLRHYKCAECGKYHLSSMKKQEHRFRTDRKYRHRVLLEQRVQAETSFWEQRLGINPERDY